MSQRADGGMLGSFVVVQLTNQLINKNGRTLLYSCVCVSEWSKEEMKMMMRWGRDSREYYHWGGLMELLQMTTQYYAFAWYRGWHEEICKFVGMKCSIWRRSKRHLGGMKCCEALWEFGVHDGHAVNNNRMHIKVWFGGGGVVVGGEWMNERFISGAYYFAYFHSTV